MYVPGGSALAGFAWSYADMYVLGGPALSGLAWSHADVFISWALKGVMQIIPVEPVLVGLEWSDAANLVGPPWRAWRGAMQAYLVGPP